MLALNDFFCGAGGIGLGFQNKGFTIKGSFDFDKFSIESYRHNICENARLVDIQELTWEDVPFADVWTFGFPCQDISVAGKQAGMVKGKTRSGMFYEIMRLLDEMREHDESMLPSIILAENVKMVRKYLPIIEKEYQKHGYKMFSILYNSKHWGVPQNRERYFIVGVREDVLETHGDFQFTKEVEGNTPRLSSVLVNEEEVDERFYMSEERSLPVIEEAMKRVKLAGTHACLSVNKRKVFQNGRRAKEDEEDMFTLTTRDQHGLIIKKEGSEKPEGEIDVVGRLNMKGIDSIKRVYSVDGISPTLISGGSSGGGNLQPKIVVESEGVLPIVENPRQVAGNFRVRRLTPREYARLQGFPDSYEQIVSNSQFYKQMGNAVTVNVAEVVANAILEYLQGGTQVQQPRVTE